MKADKPEDSLRGRLFTTEGKPLRVLSTSLGIALLANAVLVPDSHAASPSASPSAATSSPKLVEWSTEAVKKYYDPAVDWNLPIPDDEELDQVPPPATQGAAPVVTTGGTTVIQTGSGFGWDDLLLYHLLFNSGGTYSSSYWNSHHHTYYSGTGKLYQPKKYSSGSFQNKSVAGSTVTAKTSRATVPKTSKSTGSVVRRSTSSKPGGIGGKSSGFSSSSSSSHSSSSHSSGGFGG